MDDATDAPLATFNEEEDTPPEAGGNIGVKLSFGGVRIYVPSNDRSKTLGAFLGKVDVAVSGDVAL